MHIPALSLILRSTMFLTYHLLTTLACPSLLTDRDSGSGRISRRDSRRSDGEVPRSLNVQICVGHKQEKGWHDMTHGLLASSTRPLCCTSTSRDYITSYQLYIYIYRNKSTALSTLGFVARSSQCASIPNGKRAVGGRGGYTAILRVNCSLPSKSGLSHARHRQLPCSELLQSLRLLFSPGSACLESSTDGRCWQYYRRRLIQRYQWQE
jgi:hypothetical protein